jgi:hypothetical protein
MPWKFDPQAVDIVFVSFSTEQIVSGQIDFGSELSSDLSLDTGERTNDSSVVDGGLRVIDGSI